MSALLLSRADIAALMTPADYLEAVETAFRASANGRAESPPPMHIHGVAGAFHAKGALLRGAHNYAALKLNGNFPGNPERGLPTIQGVIVLSNADDGAVLAIMDSIEITLRRTAAATALAAKHLAREDAATVAVVGCGDQARPQLEALAAVRRLKRGFAFDVDRARAERFARDASAIVPFETATDLQAATRASDIVVTCTTSRTPLLSEDHVKPGAFIAAVGADNSEKSEIAPSLMAKAKVVADVAAQCAVMGDLHQAIKAGVMQAADVHGELADIVTGVKPGRERQDEIVVFDSTGTAIQDVASAAIIYERAFARGAGLRFHLGAEKCP